MQFDKEEEIAAELNMPEYIRFISTVFQSLTRFPPNSEEREKYDKLDKSYQNQTFEVVSTVFRALSRNKIIGVGDFQKFVRFIQS